jgi:hypothetical protein
MEVDVARRIETALDWGIDARFQNDYRQVLLSGNTV